MPSLKRDIRLLRDGEPGTRFRRFYEVRRRRRSGHAHSRILTLIIAVALILLGAAIGWLPGPGGFIAIFGLALLATEFRPAARALDATETTLRGMWRRFKALGPLAKSGILAGSAAAAVGAIYLGFLLIQQQG